ncbi:MAG: DUF29 domain-containing protein [Bryobacterales bacterium]|nr:DUF29 domain-containing protein [Bryobacterales bacterium]MBV9399388.1 DUF29 domain-containing protein [Bryobacterales bacterium]
MNAVEMYDRDFAEWAKTNAELLRSKRFSEIDLEHIAEEIEDLGSNKRHSLFSRFVRLIEHLLKWQYQPERRGSSWSRTIAVQRIAINDLIEENPSFCADLPAVVAKSYTGAVKVASAAIKREKKEFPHTCPFTLDQLLDDDFFPS